MLYNSHIKQIWKGDVCVVSRKLFKVLYVYNLYFRSVQMTFICKALLCWKGATRNPMADPDLCGDELEP